MKNGMDPNTTAKTLFFLKDTRHNTQPLEHYLEGRGFKVNSESTVTTALDKIKESKPDYVLVAWDHTDQSVQNILSELTDDMTIIPYITSLTEPEKRALMSLDVPFKIFPPPSGPAIQRLIVNLEREKKLSQEKNNDLFEIFISKGQRFGDMNTVFIDHNLSQNLSVSFFDSITDVSLDRPAAQFSKKMQVKISEGQKKALESIFDEQVEKELKETIETTKDFAPSEPIQNIFCMLVQSIDTSGLILLNTAWNMSLEDAEAALIAWANELTYQYHKKGGGKNIYQSKVFAIQTPLELNVFDICTTHASLKKEIIIDDKNTTLAFFDLQHNPFNLKTAEDEDYLIVDQNCLREASIIPLNLFYKLKENKKMLKIFKKNTLMSNKDINSILAKKNLPLLISIGDEMLWYKYGVEVYLKKL